MAGNCYLIEIAFTTLSIIVCLVSGQGTQTQVLTLWAYSDSTNTTTISLTLNGTKSSDLRLSNFDNTAQFINITGVWLLYTEYDYQGTTGGQAIGFPFETSELNHIYRENVSSVRYVGSALDHRFNALTLYERTRFRGLDEVVEEDVPQLRILDQRSASAILTGYGPWTIYNDTNYNGASKCIEPAIGYYTPVYIRDLLDDLDFSYDSIRSVKKGCF